MRGGPDLDELQPLGHERLVVAVGDLAAERRQDEEREDEDRAGERDQRLGSCPASLNRIRKTSAFLRKLSLKALKNWHQNSGAKRLVVIRLEDIAVPRHGGGCQAGGGRRRVVRPRQRFRERFGHASLSIPDGFVAHILARARWFHTNPR